MRFWNNEVLANIDGVLEVLLAKLVESGALTRITLTSDSDLSTGGER